MSENAEALTWVERYQADDLILLVGSNPLPNLVVGRLLRRPNGTIHLVHTRRGAGVADKLQSFLGGPCKRYQTDAVSSTAIGRTVTGIVEAFKRGSAGRVLGLNYTGGTKAMAVHAYLAMRDGTRDLRSRPVFSYLDAWTLHLLIDADPWGRSADSRYVGTALQLDLVTLAGLHGIPSGPSGQPIWPKTAAVLAHIFQSQAKHAWLDWYRGPFARCCTQLDATGKPKRKPGGDYSWLPLRAMAGVTVPWPDDPTLADVVAAWQNEVPQRVPGGFDAIAAITTHFQGKVQELGRWVNGKWLETYAFDVLAARQQSLQLSDLALSFAPDPKTRIQTDIDVVAVRGYQLFALSCSTSDTRSTVKHKVFEAYVRARQVGGEEARVALVTTFGDKGRGQDAKGLEVEMRQLFGVQADQDRENDQMVTVFGPDDLLDLGDKLEKWITVWSHRAAEQPTDDKGQS